MDTRLVMKVKVLALTVQFLSASLAIEALAAAKNEAQYGASSSKILRSSRDYHLLEEVPHDVSSFTQGLTFFEGHLYEGTGLEQQSHIMRHDPSDHMRTLTKVPLEPSHMFGEGVAYYYVWKTDERGNRMKDHRLVQLTWKDKVVKIYSLPALQVVKEFTFETHTGEGWGITFVPNTNELYVSDGSEYLMVWDADTLEEKRRTVVTFEREPGVLNNVQYLNELEFVDFGPTESADTGAYENGQCTGDGSCPDASGFTSTMRILANVWYQDVLISINPVSGSVDRVYNLMDIYPLKQREADGADCLNGIALTSHKVEGEGLEVWVTGKLWPKMYRIRLID